MPSGQGIIGGVVNNFLWFRACVFRPVWYCIYMMNDDFRDMMPTSEEFYAMMAKKDADFENAFKCDDEDDE